MTKTMEFRQLTASFAAKLETENDIEGYVDVLADAVDQIGFPMVAYSFMPIARLSNGAWMPPPLKVRNFPHRWDVQWPGHSANDPYYHACYRGAAKIDWSDIQKRDDLSLVERDLWNYLADKQLDKGITIPIHLPGRRFAFVTALWRGSLHDHAEAMGYAVNSLFLLSHYFHASMYSKFRDPFKSASSAYMALSERELDCLALAARGKTAGEAAQISGSVGGDRARPLA